MSETDSTPRKTAVVWTHEPASVDQVVARLPVAARQALQARVRSLSAVLGGTGADPAASTTPDPVGASGDADRLVQTVTSALGVVGAEPDRLWLAHAVLGATLPSDEDMIDLMVRARLGGTWAALAPVVTALGTAHRFPDVEIVQDAVTCDVHTTAESEFLSGVQRVVRETTSRWEPRHPVEFVGWGRDMVSLRRLRSDDFERLFGRPPRNDAASPVVVPWRCTHLWVEVITDLRRTGRLLAMARYSGNRVGVLGYDSIPITSSVTVAHGMTSHFARSYAALRRVDRVAMISSAAAAELRAVIGMGAGRRDAGPQVESVPLAIEARTATPEDLEEARTGLVMPGVPMVLVVGSHEPRKNHLAVLYAAETLWREGVRFSLVLVGGGSWRAEGYQLALAELVGRGRPVQSIRALPDRLLWAAYRIAHVTLFPSLNEGFGLPVAESLAAGTPVITSAFGSMRDILAPDGVPVGGLLVDPRDDASIADALRTVVTDAELHARLTAETGRHRPRSWDVYAEELWSFLVDHVAPTP